VAVGRRPNTKNIGIENTKIKTDREFLKVNEWMQTGEPGVWAIGDIVAGTPQLAHVASMEGFVAVGKIAGKNVHPINYRQSPSATYCEPQIGAVGLTEAQARKEGYPVKIGKFTFGGNSKASILGQHGGFVKVVAEEKYGEILGVHIIGPSATELISEAVVAMSSEATIESMMETIHSHPTLAEAVKDAFDRVYGLSVNS
jgi:dihydrolipoamide dehydrogenase